MLMDGALPHKCAPKTYAEARTLSLNLERALREKSHKAVFAVAQSSLAETQSLEHQILTRSI